MKPCHSLCVGFSYQMHVRIKSSEIFLTGHTCNRWSDRGVIREWNGTNNKILIFNKRKLWNNINFYTFMEFYTRGNGKHTGVERQCPQAARLPRTSESKRDIPFTKPHYYLERCPHRKVSVHPDVRLAGRKKPSKIALDRTVSLAPLSTDRNPIYTAIQWVEKIESSIFRIS